MFAHFANLARRTDGAPPFDRTMVTLLVVLLVLLIVALFLVAGLLYLRYRRRARRNAELPPYSEDDEKRMSSMSTTSSHRRVMVRPSESVLVYSEKQSLADSSSSPPPSPLPEIHITFPEEVDDSGKRTSGRVVVVRVGDNGIGLEPVEGLPAYSSDDKRFESLDLDRIGGLVEKAKNAPSYDKLEKI
ncbi:hypothetical protein CBER1_00605 [Cercospora berteroae]|uniref:Uncharacterized protein n=1 Tax=Cercospora berteroae TaxID=357750 RepID=A0A2S6CB84_9PEZI|nr:hypothetical protein CBER1_00605 [Cercospora berteroae]